MGYAYIQPRSKVLIIPGYHEEFDLPLSCREIKHLTLTLHAANDER